MWKQTIFLSSEYIKILRLYELVNKHFRDMQRCKAFGIFIINF